MREFIRIVVGRLVLLCVLVSTACVPEPPDDPVDPITYDASGTVVSVEGEMILIDHEDIEGFMDAMTMTFPVTDPALLVGLEQGSRVTFRVVAEGASYTIDRIEIVDRD